MTPEFSPHIQVGRLWREIQDAGYKTQELRAGARLEELEWCMSRAILTKWYSHSWFYPLFMRYYEPFFDVVEHCILPSQPDNRCYQIEIDLINAALSELKGKHDLVMVADLDEIVVANPDKYHDFGDYLDRFDKRGIRVIGYNVIGMPDDKPLDLERKITDQRSYWEREPVYDKPMITRASDDLDSWLS